MRILKIFISYRRCFLPPHSCPDRRWGGGGGDDGRRAFCAPRGGPPPPLSHCHASFQQERRGKVASGDQGEMPHVFFCLSGHCRHMNILDIPLPPSFAFYHSPPPASPPLSLHNVCVLCMSLSIYWLFVCNFSVCLAPLLLHSMHITRAKKRWALKRRHARQRLQQNLPSPLLSLLFLFPFPLSLLTLLAALCAFALSLKDGLRAQEARHAAHSIPQLLCDDSKISDLVSVSERFQIPGF